jgi:hypothetical protein
MEDKFDKLLYDIFGSSDRYDHTRGDKVRDKVATMYDTKLRFTRYFVWAWLVFCTALIVVSVFTFIDSDNVKILLGCAAIAVIAHEGSVLMKLWYWQQNTKYTLLKEMAELKLQIAQLNEKTHEDFADRR